jgi:ABC-type transport system involved in multi-copper enzyme maturation permease subunit
MTAIRPYQSLVRPGRDGFGQLVHAEWTKLRSVRGWVAAIVLVPVLTVALALLTHSGCSAPGPNGQSVACPAPPTGPGGEAVIDSFYFAHQALTGNGAITARVTSLTGQYSPGGGRSANGAGRSSFRPGVQPWAKAGIMIKANTAQGSAYASMLVTGGNGVRMQWNYTGDTAGLPGSASAPSPRWLRLVRAGDTVTGYDSPDGTHWTAVSSVTLSGLPRVAQVGLFATSPDYEGTISVNGGSGTAGPSEATGTFDHVGLTWNGANQSWVRTSIGPVGEPGTNTLVNGPNPFHGAFTHSVGTYTVTGSGDIAPDVPETPAGIGTKAQNELFFVFVGLIAVIIVSALFITAEYRRGLIRATFAASPRRGRVLAAKAVVIGLVTFVAGLTGAAVALAVGVRLNRDAGNPVLPDPAFTEIRMVIMVGAMLAAAAVLALALGTLARRSVTAIAVVIVVIFLPFLLATVPGDVPLGAQEWLLRVTPAAAFAVVQDIPAYHQVAAQYLPAFGYFPLSWWAGFAVICGWAVAALAAATYVLRRRDV